MRKKTMAVRSASLLFGIFALGTICTLFGSSTLGQRIAILTPESSTQNTIFADRLEDELAKTVRIIDRGAAESAFLSLKIESPFNLTSEQSKRIGEVIGCGHFVIVHAATTRRTSSTRPSYFEAYAAVFLVNSQTGLLDLFLIESKQRNTASEAETSLGLAAATIADSIVAKVKSERPPSDSKSPFEPFDPDSKAMRPAMPYKRIKPEYTQSAYLYGISATVDAEVSIDASGDVKRIEITRWAGFGLDESVIAAIRAMNWRHGEKNGKPLPMRVLLRYNFTKAEKEQ